MVSARQKRMDKIAAVLRESGWVLNADEKGWWHPALNYDLTLEQVGRGQTLTLRMAPTNCVEEYGVALGWTGHVDLTTAVTYAAIENIVASKVEVGIIGIKKMIFEL
jgi:hypothetical protein